MQSLQGFITIVNWKINQTEVTENFCENKAKPMMHCNGKCHLAKQLKLQEEQEQKSLSKKSSKKSSPKVKTTKVEQVVTENFALFLETNSNSPTIKNKPLFNSEKYLFEGIEDCFHPPQV